MKNANLLCHKNLEAHRSIKAYCSASFQKAEEKIIWLEAKLKDFNDKGTPL